MSNTDTALFVSMLTVLQFTPLDLLLIGCLQWFVSEKTTKITKSKTRHSSSLLVHCQLVLELSFASYLGYHYIPGGLTRLSNL